MILVGDALERLRGLAPASVQCVVSSPPYFGLRDYGTGSWEGGDSACVHRVGGQVSDGKAPGAIAAGVRPGVDASTCRVCGAQRVDQQIGLEPTPERFVAILVDVFREVRRVLRDDGTVWLNLGDSYNTRKVTRPSSHQAGLGFESEHLATSWAQHAEAGAARMPIADGGLKEKDLFGIPWMVAFALRADGWYLRSEIVWAKPNPMPESVRDRPTSAHEKLFLLSKRPSYFYDVDAIREPHTDRSVVPYDPEQHRESGVRNGRGIRDGRASSFAHAGNALGRNKRNVWEIPSMPFPDAHFATFPPALVEPCVLAGSSPQACAKCGAPWRRVTERAYENPGGRTTNGPRSVEHRHLEHGSAGFKQRLELRVQTVGWEPTCEHADGSGRCVVLDPFAGSGTVGVVCEWYGRDFIGVELNPEYAELAERRIATDGALRRSARRPRMPADSLQLGLLD